MLTESIYVTPVQSGLFLLEKIESEWFQMGNER